MPGTLRSAALAALLLASVGGCSAEPSASPLGGGNDVWQAGPPLPMPISNNAVAAVEIDGRLAVFSFLGLDSTKVWSGVTNRAFRWDEGDTEWTEIDAVPGPGRLASTAQVVDGVIYVIGGYTVAEDGAERSVPNVDVYDPHTGQWSRGADIPVPTDDAVAGVWRDSTIVLVSGWHDSGNISDVQLYDPATDAWSALDPIPGPPVFGHTGAVVGDDIVYVDGTAVVDAAPRFAIAPGSWRGSLSGDGVSWAAVPAHPGPALYRAAGGTVGNVILFVGGTDNPYNYNGIGYDGAPAEPIRQVLAYTPQSGDWRRLPAPPIATMDHRNLGIAGGRVVLVGGMVAGQVVTGELWIAPVDALLAGLF